MNLKVKAADFGALALVLAAAGGAFLSGCAPNETGSTAAQAQQPAAAVSVQTTRPEHRNVSRLISLPGDIHPWEETTLYAKVPGYLSRISVDKGDRVTAGQVVATIDAPELTADREQARQTYESALAAARGSRATNERTAAEMRRSKTAEEKAQADYEQMPATVARAQAQLTQAQAGIRQAEEQKNQAAAALEEAHSQVDAARADLDAVKADQHLADVTYTRYQSIYDKNPQLLAKQEVDVAESRAAAARGKTAAAVSELDHAQHHVRSAEAQVNAAQSQIDQSKAAAAAAREQVRLAVAQQNSALKQLQIAGQDVQVTGKQQAVANAKTEESEYQATASRSALTKMAVVSDYARIRAPFSGVITKRFVDKGAFIQTAATSQNAAPIVTVADLDQVRLYLAVPETQAGFVQVGTPVSVVTSGLPDETLKGRVARTTGSLDPKTRTLLAEVDLPNHDRKILTGAYATAKVVMETHPGVISVPTPAVGVEKSGKFVFVVDNGKAKRVPVVTGFDDGAYTEITEGLHGGEEVVVTGRETLTPNAAVHTTAWTPPVKKSTPHG